MTSHVLHIYMTADAHTLHDASSLMDHWSSFRFFTWYCPSSDYRFI